MRLRSLPLAVVACAVLAFGAQAQTGYPTYGLKTINGNDTGGIIPWTPENHANSNEMAGYFCAGYNKAHRITSVTRGYGNYIAFSCFFPRDYDPVRAGAVVQIPFTGIYLA